MKKAILGLLATLAFGYGYALDNTGKTDCRRPQEPVTDRPGQARQDLVTDRPGPTESAEVVPLFTLQVETGISHEWVEKGIIPNVAFNEIYYETFNNISIYINVFCEIRQTGIPFPCFLREP